MFKAWTKNVNAHFISLLAWHICPIIWLKNKIIIVKIRSTITLILSSTAGVWAGAVRARERWTAGICRLHPAADCRPLSRHPGTGGERYGGVVMTAPHRPPVVSSHRPLFFLRFLISQPTDASTKTQTFSPAPTCAKIRTDTYMGKTDGSWKWSARSNWPRAEGGVGFYFAIP